MGKSVEDVLGRERADELRKGTHVRDFLKGGNWTDGVHTGFFSVEATWKDQFEKYPVWEDDVEGLSNRWVRILMGETGWIQKSVFKSGYIIDDPPVKRSAAEKKKSMKWYKKHKKEFG